MRFLLIAQREKKAIFIGERIFLFSKICNLFQGSKLFWKVMNEHEVISKENKLLLYIQVRKIWISIYFKRNKCKGRRRNFSLGLICEKQTLLLRNLLHFREK